MKITIILTGDNTAAQRIRAYLEEKFKNAVDAENGTSKLEAEFRVEQDIDNR